MEMVGVEAEVSKATRLIDEAEQRTREFEALAGQEDYDKVIAATDEISDLLEEAQQLLLESEADGLPDAEVAPVEAPEDHEPEVEAAELTEEEAQPFDFTLAKQELEHRSRLIEARLYRKAADRIGEPITEPGKATEQQDELLNNAAVALEAGLGSKPAPETLLALLELRVLQLEIKKARYLAELLVQIDAEGALGAKGQEWLDRFDSDKSLKDKGKCFIATAACGANDAPDVLALRRFRDDVLVRSKVGRRVIDIYYRLSPPLARTIETHPPLARAVHRLLVAPMARIVRHV
jgi:hypothetical protein